jgi:hypothetical protein
VRAGERIGGYDLERPLGRGEAGATWIARSQRTGDEVVLKILDIGEARDWTGVELFGREIDALKTLSHPGIPRFIESFEDDDAGDSRLVLAMELLPGIDLETATEGRRFSETEVGEILASLADILGYLGSQRPPVVHRDVNPRNILLGPDGRVSLVDFSGAQDALHRAASHGTTLIGTAGYIPLEQISGRATVRSDLYGAAATALFLLTRRNPAELPIKDLKPDLEALPPLGSGMAAVLDSWLEPDEKRRDIQPAEAARILRGEAKAPKRAGRGSIRMIDATEANEPAPSRAIIALPSDSKVKIAENTDQLEIIIPPAGLANPATAGIKGFSLLWIAFVAFWTFMAIMIGAPVFFVLFSLPFWAVGIAIGRATFISIFGHAKLLLDASQGIVYTERVLFTGRTRSWPIADLGECSIEAAAFQIKGKTDKELVLEAGAKTLRIGKSLSERELRAIAGRIEQWRDNLER